MKRIILTLAAGMALAIAGAAQAAGPTAKVESGVIAGVQQDGVNVFKGVPYAKPPVGALRWTPPQRAAVWTGERKALDFGAPAAAAACRARRRKTASTSTSGPRPTPAMRR